MAFGERLKEIRTESKISQKKVASDLGVSTTSISQYESNSRFPNEETIKRLCLYYKISSDYLFGLTDEKHSPLSKEEARKKMISSKQMRIIDYLSEIFETGEENKNNDN